MFDSICWVELHTMIKCYELSTHLTEKIIHLHRSGMSCSRSRSLVQSTACKQKLPSDGATLPKSGGRPHPHLSGNGFRLDLNHIGPDVPWAESCWNSSVSVFSQAGFTILQHVAEDLKKKFLLQKSTFNVQCGHLLTWDIVCRWPHGQRKKPLEECFVVRWDKELFNCKDPRDDREVTLWHSTK